MRKKEVGAVKNHLFMHYFPFVCRNHDCWRPRHGEPARFPAVFASQLPGNDLPRDETKSPRYGGFVQLADSEPTTKGAFLFFGIIAKV